MDPPEREKLTSTPVGRSLFSRTLSRRDVNREIVDDDKGPFGLTTLHVPKHSAIADLIFVHGLGGGSRSTWTKNGDPSLYWPQEWLPHDAAFPDVRIHTFGYNSNWSKESTLSIQDFAKSLLGSVQDCPAIARGSKDPIVFVGHSMGGLVIKRAYIIAKQKKEFQGLADRVKTIMFLATPHRGSDLAQLLERILRVTIGANSYVGDLRRDSLATQSINEEFPHFGQELQLYSFYETLPTNYGIGKGLVVDKHLATLGYANERTALVNANHREICKYSDQNDPNYKIVKNALAAAIGDFRVSITSKRHDISIEQRRALKTFLGGVSEAPEDDFMGIDALRMPGSCEWLVKKPAFNQWLNGAERQLYWITAKPATGKTVLSGRIVKHLKDLRKDCSFYFFHYSDKGKSIISSFLLSMAWQTALLQPSVLNTVLKIYEKDDALAKEDYRSIWRKLFLEGILKMVDQTQYWVIDALDECKNNADLVLFLMKAVELCPIRIILTSRNRFESHKIITLPKIQVFQDEILEEDTKFDIALYIEANMDKLPSIDEVDGQDMVRQILAKSAGCFLWVSLVLQELAQVHMLSDVQDILDKVPSNMNDLYKRILDSMSRAAYGKTLTKAILTWTVCAARPLKTAELRDALKLEIKTGMDSLERSITSSCGQLVYVDAQSRVLIVHQTAREFLLRAPISLEFVIDEREGHRQLAMTCLEYLNGNEMRAPRRRKLSASRIPTERSQIENYACNMLFEHIIYVPSTDNDFLLALAKFLGSTNVLAWIQYIAQHSNPARLIQTARAFGDFLKRRSKHMSPFGNEVALLDSWTSDLVRLVTKFGKHLIASPSSIFYLIPPFCPPNTAIRKQLATPGRGISVVGLSATSWDDCLSTIVDPRETFSALACSKRGFAIGMSSGKIAIHNATTCQETQTLTHNEPVRILQFGEQADLLASAGSRTVRIWSTASWQQLWNLDAPKQCMALTFTDEDRLLLGAQKNNHFMMWDLSDGSLRDTADWTQCLEGQSTHLFRRPVTAAFCMDINLLAVVYRGQDILLWDLGNDSLYDTYSKQTGAGPRPDKRIFDPGVRSLIFSQAPNANLLAAAYVDGDLVLFDTSEGVVKETTVAYAHILACSADGRTLASGDPSGTIQLFEFETLKLIYRINSAEYGIQGLAFSDDSQRLLDIRGSQCRVWDPTVLVRQDVDEAVSDTISVSTTLQETSLDSLDDVVLITSLACFGNGDLFLCGKEDGSVCLYDTTSGMQIQRLFSHANGIAVVSLFFEEKSQTLTSIDSSSRIMTHHMNIDSRSHVWEAKEAVFEHRAGVAIDQALGNDGLTRMLVCSAKVDTLWSISSDGNRIVETLSWEERGPYRWAGHPANPEQLILVSKNEAHIYEWRALRRLTDGYGIFLEGSIVPELSIRDITSCFNGTVLASTFSESLRPHAKSKLLLWNTSDFVPESKSAAPVPTYYHLADSVEVLIGASGQRLVFLHSDNWICSADPQTTSANEYIRHFFLPADWLTTNIEFMIQVTGHGHIVFVKRDEVAVIKRGLESTEHGPPRSAGLRPSLAGRSRSSLDVPPFYSP